jgi:FtsP/CotA-like multicopper oxidase with cupredoxin domain
MVQLWFSTFNTDGVVGDRLLTNWIYQPEMQVRPRRYRFRIMNGDVSRYMRIAVVVEDENGAMLGVDNKRFSFAEFYMIANDGNLMSYAVPFGVDYDPSQAATPGKSNRAGILPMMAIGERHDIIIDFGKYPGKELYLINTMDHKHGRSPNGPKTFEESVQRVQDILAEERDQQSVFWQDTAVGKITRFKVVDQLIDEDRSLDPADYVEGNAQGNTLIPPAEHGIQVFDEGKEDYRVNGERVQFRRFRWVRSGDEIMPEDWGDLPGTYEGASVPGDVADTTAAVYHHKDLAHAEIKAQKQTLAVSNQNEINLKWAVKTEFTNKFGLEADKGAYLADPRVVSVTATTGEFEVWEFDGNGGWMHNVHTHFEEGHLISRDNGLPNNGIPDWEKFSRKDVYTVGSLLQEEAGDSLRFSIRFRDLHGTFMTHCHNTNHEDGGMLNRWDINNPGQVKAFSAPMNTWNGCTYQSSITLEDVESL